MMHAPHTILELVCASRHYDVLRPKSSLRVTIGYVQARTSIQGNFDTGIVEDVTRWSHT